MIHSKVRPPCHLNTGWLLQPHHWNDRFSSLFSTFRFNLSYIEPHIYKWACNTMISILQFFKSWNYSYIAYVYTIVALSDLCTLTHACRRLHHSSGSLLAIAFYKVHTHTHTRMSRVSKRCTHTGLHNPLWQLCRHQPLGCSWNLRQNIFTNNSDSWIWSEDLGTKPTE